MSQKIEQKIVFSKTTFSRKYHNTYSFLLHPVSFRLYCLKKRGKASLEGKIVTQKREAKRKKKKKTREENESEKEEEKEEEMEEKRKKPRTNRFSNARAQGKKV